MSEDNRRRIMMSFRVTPGLKQAIDEAAGQRGVTVTDLIVEILETHLPVRSRTDYESKPSFFD